MGARGPTARTFEQGWEYLLANRVINGDCWLLEIGSPIGIGYRRIRAGGYSWYIHEMAYKKKHGVCLPIGKVHRHTCHRPNCFNPDHVIGGTHADNVADKVVAGRQPKGQTHYKTFLNDQDIRNIRASTLNLGQLSRQYAISRGAILKIRNRESWKHVE